MQIVKHFKKPKNLILFAVLAGVLVLMAPRKAEAFFGELIGDLTSTFVSKAVFYLLYIVSFIAVQIFTLVNFLVKWAIDLNNMIISQPIVTYGWQIILSFTNLGFVLVIIIIAFATILRWETYAIKQTLWKLIVVALLVNFSLMIAGAFISVSDIVTKYFQDKTDLNNNTFSKFADKMAAQKFGITIKEFNDCVWFGKDSSGSLIKGDACHESNKNKIYKDVVNGYIDPNLENFTCSCVTKKAEEVDNLVFSNMSKGVITAITGLIFVIVFTIIAVITMTALFIMLLIRFVALQIILILSPLALLCWILPSTRSIWSKWWNIFLRWTFFAPIMFFFIYLTFNTMILMSSSNDNKIEVALNKYSATADITSSISQMIAIIGLLLGGLMAANSLSITGASTAMNLASKAGKGAAGWAGRKGISGLRRTGSRVLGSEFLREKVGANLQKLGSGLDPNTRLGKLGRFAVGMTGVNKLGNAIQAGGARQGEALVKKAEEAQKKYSDKELATRVHQMSGHERQAALIRLAKNNTTDLVAGGVDQYLTHKERDSWARSGNAKQFEDFEKKIGRSVEMVQAKDSESLEKASENHYMKYKFTDWQNIDPKLFIDKKYGDVATKNMLKEYPSALNKISANVKGADRSNFDEKINEMKGQITNLAAEELDAIIMSTGIAKDQIGQMGLMDIDKKLDWIKTNPAVSGKYNEMNKKHSYIPKMQKSVDRHLGGRITGYYEEKYGEEEKKEEKKET